MELLDIHTTWVGLGVKVGGSLVFGFESTEGIMFRLDLPHTSHQEVNITNVRLGLGLGGSIGAVLIYAVNCHSLWDVDRKQLTDLGINIQIPQTKFSLGRFSTTILKGLKGQGANFVKRATPKFIADLRDFGSYLYNYGDLGDKLRRKEPDVIAIDVPGIGWGAELSINYTTGEFMVIE